MKLVWWMLAGSSLTAAVLTLWVGTQTSREIWLGMLGPLVAAVASWIAMVRQNARSQLGMTRLLIKAFAVKMVFFAVYIIVLLRIHCVRPIPFVICFASFYLALHIVEAIGLRRMQTAGRPAEPEMP